MYSTALLGLPMEALKLLPALSGRRTRLGHEHFVSASQALPVLPARSRSQELPAHVTGEPAGNQT